MAVHVHSTHFRTAPLSLTECRAVSFSCQPLSLACIQLEGFVVQLSASWAFQGASHPQQVLQLQFGSRGGLLALLLLLLCLSTCASSLGASESFVSPSIDRPFPSFAASAHVHQHMHITYNLASNKAGCNLGSKHNTNDCAFRICSADP